MSLFYMFINFQFFYQCFFSIFIKDLFVRQLFGLLSAHLAKDNMNGSKA